MYKDNMNLKSKIITYISVLLLLCSVVIQTKDLFIKNDNYTVEYEYINTKDMAQANVVTKSSSSKPIAILTGTQNLGDVEAVSMANTSQPEAVELPVQQNSSATVTERQIWYLPVEMGQISQYPRYGHNAYDITSPRGTAETIHPVANGVISGIYTDYAGALIVTVLHEVDGVKYTSQYVHLSSYAEGIYVGKPVTINDALGQMGTTGYSTGVHLHLAVMDCALFDSSDPNCSNLGSWYNYTNYKLSQNFYGLGVLMYVPNSWSSR